MKKAVRLPYLAVSALSLGVVGLATFTPIANAAVQTSTKNSTFTVNVTEGAGIDPNDKAGATSTLANVSLNLAARTTGVVTAGGSIYNNTGAAGTLTVKDQDADTNLVGDNGTIPTKAGKLAAATASWGIAKGSVAADSDDFRSMVAKDAENGIDVAPAATTGKQNFVVTYGASSGDSQAGSYANTVVYTFTAGK